MVEVIPKEEVLSLEDGETRTLHIVAYAVEEVQFPEYTDPTWKTTIPARRFPALLIHITEENGRPLRRHYWIDSRRLILSLLPLLEEAGGIRRTYRVTKHGTPPHSHYEVAIT